MKTTTLLLRLAIALLSASLASSQTWDLRLQQLDGSGRPREVLVTPAANSLLGFDASKRAVNVTPGTNIAISGNQISATGNVTNNGTLTDSYLVMGGGGGEVRPTTIQVTGGNNIVLANLTANSTAIGNITGATSDFDLLIGDQATGFFRKGNITVGANMTRTKVGNNIELDSTAGGGTPDDGSVTFPKLAPAAVVTSSEGIASNSNNTSVPTTQAVKEYADGISAGSLPGGLAPFFETANLGSLPAGFFASGSYGTAGPQTLGDYTLVVRSLGDVAAPTVDVAPGAVPVNTVVTFSSATAGAFFTATNNGTDPTYTVGTVGGNFTVSANMTVEYRANKQGYVSSAVQSGTWTIDPIPTLSSAVLQASGTDIVIGWPESVSYGAGGTGGYALTASGGAVSVTGVTGGGTTSHTLTTNRTITNAESVTLDYTNPGNGAEDSAFQDVVTFTGFTVNTSGGPAGGGGGASYSDNFDGGGQFPIASPWETSPGDWTDMYRNSGALLSSGGDAAARLGTSAATFAGDQWAELKPGSTYLDGSGPAVRMSATGNCYYLIGFNNAGTHELRIFKATADGATKTQVGASFSLGAYPQFSGTVVLRLKATGTSTTTLEAYIDGALQGSRTDSSSPHTSGQPGVIQLGGASGGDDFAAADV